MLKYYLKTIMISWRFLVCVALMTGILLMGGYSDFAMAMRGSEIPGSLLVALITSTNINTGTSIGYVVAALPFLFVYCEAKDSRMNYYFLIRSRKGSYYINQALAAILSVIALCVLSLAVFTVIGLLCGLGLESTIEVEDFFHLSLLKGLLRHGALPLYLLQLFQYTMNMLPGMFFALLMSLFLKNKYIIMAVPYAASVVMSHLSVYTHECLDWGMTSNLMSLTDTIPGTVYMFVYCPFLVMVLFLIYYGINMRRFHNGKI